MPFENQYGSKTAHGDVVRNPDVQAFLESCEPIREPSDEAGEELASFFIEPPDYAEANGSQFVLCSDGSFYQSSIEKRLPSIQVCYLKFSTLLIEMNDFHGLADNSTGMIDPFRVAALQRDRQTLSAVLPLSNFRLRDDDCVKTSFRRQMDSFLWSENTRHRRSDPGTSLMATVIELATLRPSRNGPTGQVLIHKCPNNDCETENIYLDPEEPQHSCPDCGRPLYISDCLRLWEAVSDFHPNVEPASRFMSYVEHLLPIHYLRFIADEAPSQLSRMAVFVDGPLAVFGHAAWLHQSIMRFLHRMREQQQTRGYEMPVVMGLQKTGYVVEYMQLLERHIPRNRLFSISDDFRYEYLGIERSGNGFGSETYYGQDFAFKTPSGKLFVISLPYPFSSKSNTAEFSERKTEIDRYTELTRALNLICEVETDLYRDALVPIALAHRHTAISLRPGGHVLDVMGRTARSTNSIS
jgi:hypothetical protein